MHHSPVAVAAHSHPNHDILHSGATFATSTHLRTFICGYQPVQNVRGGWHTAHRATCQNEVHIQRQLPRGSNCFKYMNNIAIHPARQFYIYLLGLKTPKLVQSLSVLLFVPDLAFQHSCCAASGLKLGIQTCHDSIEVSRRQFDRS
jgi:hypothetical protein